MAAFDMSLFMRRLLFFVLLYGDVTGSVIYNERIAGDTCTYILVCNFEIVPVPSIVACAIKVTHAGSGVMFYDTAEGTCSVCHPTESDVHQLASGQIFYTGGTYPLCDLSVIVILFSMPPLISLAKTISIVLNRKCFYDQTIVMNLKNTVPETLFGNV